MGIKTIPLYYSGRMEVTGQIAAIICALILLVLAFKFFGKEKYPTSTMLALASAVILLCSFPWFQGFVKTWLVGYVRSRLNDLGQQVNQVQTATSEMHQLLATNQGQIEKHQKELEEVQAKVKDAQADLSTQQKDITNQQFRISSMQTELNTAQGDLLTQEKKLEDVDYLVKHLFESTSEETIPYEDTNRVSVLDFGDGNGRVFFKLNSIPVKNSVQGVARVYKQPPNMAFLGNQITFSPPSFNNVVVVNFKSDQAKYMTFNFRYVRDSRETNMVQKVEIRDRKVFLRLSDGESYDFSQVLGN
jgi:hypothetical protein